MKKKILILTISFKSMLQVSCLSLADHLFYKCESTVLNREQLSNFEINLCRIMIRYDSKEHLKLT